MKAAHTDRHKKEAKRLGMVLALVVSDGRFMKRLVFAIALTLLPVSVWAQASGAPPDTAPTTAPGHELTLDLSGYNYVEPGDLRISIHGVKFGGEYSGTFLLNARQHWFTRTNVRAKTGRTDYDGWCAPWLITPDRSSPNGYALNVGDFSTYDDSGNRDWYVEGRALAGNDLVGHRWTWSPETGLGIRHLSNALDGIAGYRTDNYLYLPVGLTARTAVASHNVLTLNVEYDHLIHGWQTTRDSAFGGSAIDATTTAPAFTLDGLTDVSFDQHQGWALRAGAKFEMTRRVSVEPYWIHWQVGDSPDSFETATYTVNGITARQDLGVYEPHNTTDEFGVKFSFRVR